MDNTDVTKIEGMLIDFKDEIKGEFQHQLNVQREDFQKQLAFVGEGFQMLSEKLDRVEARLDGRIDCVVRKLDALAADSSAHTVAIRGLTVETNAHTVAIRDLAHKVDNLAADLSAHRADTEAHHPVYRVKE